MKYLIFSFLFLGAIVTSCGQHSNEPLVLNEGQPWEVIETMIVYIRSMEKNVSSFNGSTINDYQALSTSLKDDIDLLTSNCTMTGQAHDELHKWLVPYIGMVNDISDSSTDEEAKSQYQNIVRSFKTFNKYFN